MKSWHAFLFGTFGIIAGTAMIVVLVVVRSQAENYVQVQVESEAPIIDPTTIRICNSDSIATTTAAMVACSASDISDSLTLSSAGSEAFTMVFKVTDANNFSNVQTAEAAFYKAGTANDEDCTADNNNCYGGTSRIACTKAIDASGTAGYFKCPLTLEYYTYPGTWHSYAYASDLSALVASATATDEAVTTLVAATFNNIDFGILSLGYSTAPNDEEQNDHLNNGNVIADFDIYTLSNLNCDGEGYIPATGIGFDAISSTGYASATYSLAATSTVEFDGLDAPVRTDDAATAAHIDYSYWSINIPSTGVYGSCIATVSIIAEQDGL